MYSGRDKVSAITEKEHFETTETRKDKIRTILEKIPSLDLNLEIGVLRTAADKIDLGRF